MAKFDQTFNGNEPNICISTVERGAPAATPSTATSLVANEIRDTIGWDGVIFPSRPVYGTQP